MIRILVVSTIAVGLFTTISHFIPDQFTANIDNSIVYFLGYLWNLNGIIDVATLFDALYLIGNFLIGLMIFYIFHWIIRLTAGY